MLKSLIVSGSLLGRPSVMCTKLYFISTVMSQGAFRAGCISTAAVLSGIMGTLQKVRAAIPFVPLRRFTASPFQSAPFTYLIVLAAQALTCPPHRAPARVVRFCWNEGGGSPNRPTTNFAFLAINLKSFQLVPADIQGGLANQSLRGSLLAQAWVTLAIL